MVVLSTLKVMILTLLNLLLFVMEGRKEVVTSLEILGYWIPFIAEEETDWALPFTELHHKICVAILADAENVKNTVEGIVDGLVQYQFL